MSRAEAKVGRNSQDNRWGYILADVDYLRYYSAGEQKAPDGSQFVPEETDHAPDSSGIIMYRFGAPLCFANAILFEEEVEKLVTQAVTSVKWFVLDAEAMFDIDTTGEEVLHQVLTWLAKRGVTVAVSHANQSTSALLAQYHLLELIGENRLYPTNRHAIAAFCGEMGQAMPETTAE